MAVGAPTRGLSVSAEVIATEYCVSPPESDVFTLRLTVALDVRNDTSSDVILARHPVAGSPRLAESVELGRKGVMTLEYDFHTYPSDSESHFGQRPDSEQFVILKPDESYQTQMRSSVLVRRKGKTVPGTLVEGSPYAVDVPIEWWAPLASVSDDRVAELWGRWRRHGKLVVGTSASGWIEFSAPVIGRVGPCPQR